MPLIRKYEKYNPGEVLSSYFNRDEYDFLFSSKVDTAASTAVFGLLRSLKEVGSSVMEVFSGSATSYDPARAGEIQRFATMYSAGFQTMLGLSKAVTGDVYSGTYNALLGILGVSCSREGKSKDMLKTYTVITFINGCVQAMEVVQMTLAGVPLFGHGMSAAISVGHTISILNPCASFLGAFVSWQYIKSAKQQYLLALAHYQLQMLMMQQQQQALQVLSIQSPLVGDRDLKRLPPIEELEEENDEIFREGTGGSENCRIECPKQVCD